MIRELYELLLKANIEDPYILVGYSRGTWLTRLFTHYYPNQAVGVVLIDPIPEFFEKEKEESWLPFDRQELMYQMMPVITWLGITRITSETNGMEWFTNSFKAFSIDDQNEFYNLTIYKPEYWLYAAVELKSENPVAQEIKANIIVKDIPVIILNNPDDASRQSLMEKISRSVEATEKFDLELVKSASQFLILDCQACGDMTPVTGAEEVAKAIQAALDLIKP